jgi:hypothetical protein
VRASSNSVEVANRRHNRYYFAKKFEHLIEAAKARAIEIGETEKTSPPWTRRISTLMSRNTILSAVEEEDDKKPKKKTFMRKLRPEMIRRMDRPPQLINPSGWISEGAQTHSPEPQIEEKKDSVELQRPTFTGTLVSSPHPVPDTPTSPSASHLSPPGSVEPGFSMVYTDTANRRRLSDPGRISPQPSSPITRR